MRGGVLVARREGSPGAAQWGFDPQSEPPLPRLGTGLGIWGCFFVRNSGWVLGWVAQGGGGVTGPVGLKEKVGRGGKKIKFLDWWWEKIKNKSACSLRGGGNKLDYVTQEHICGSKSQKADKKGFKRPMF